MNIAFCFSGQLRNVYSTYEQWYKPNVIDVNEDHEIDFFAHSWFDNTTIGTVYKAANEIPDLVDASAPIPPNIISQVYDCYNPKQVLLERQLVFDEKNYNTRRMHGAVPQNGLSRLYSIFRASELRRNYEIENGFKYDVVAFARYDFQFKQPFKFDIVTQKAVYHPGYSPHGFNVCYAMGPSEIMDVYSALHLNVDAVFETGVVWCDELLAVRYLQMVNIPAVDFRTLNGINRTGG